MNTELAKARMDNIQQIAHRSVDDLGQIFDLLSAWKLKSKNAPRDLKFNHNLAI